MKIVTIIINLRQKIVNKFNYKLLIFSVMDITAIFLVGFIVLGIYKLFELFVKKKERILLIEKLPTIINNKEELGSINLPSISLGSQNYGSWALRVSLLLIGIGLGCIVAVFLRTMFLEAIERVPNYEYREMVFLIKFACITFFGGLGLFFAYIIELKQLKNKK